MESYTPPEWSFIRINVRLVDPTGPLVPVLGIPTHLGVVDPSGSLVVPHWCDIQLAMAWAQEAQRILDHIDQNGGKGIVDDFAIMYALATAIANSYNAMNIPWYLDPAHRALWRQYLSGPPRSAYGSSTDEFLVNRDYNRAWFTDGSEFPVGGGPGAAPWGRTQRSPTRDPFSGIIPASARNRVISVDPSFARRPTEFHFTWGLFLDAQDPEHTPDNHIFISTHRINKPFVSFPLTGGHGSGSVSVENVDPNWTNEWHPLQTNRSHYFCIEGNASRSSGCDASSPWNWDTAAYNQAGWDVSSNNVAGMVWGPLHSYLPYARAVVSALNSRSVLQTIWETRQYATLYMLASINGMRLTSIADLSRAFDVSQLNAEAESHRLDPNVQIAAAIVASIGGALAAETYGISAVAGAAIAAGLQIWDATRVHDVHGAKDDLGRRKPNIEIGWLDGVPSPGDQNKPTADLVVPQPPGFQRTATILQAPEVSRAPVSIAILPPSLTTPPRNAPSLIRGGSGGSSNALWWLLGLGAAATGVGYAVSRRRSRRR